MPKRSDIVSRIQRKGLFVIMCLFSLNVYADWEAYTVDQGGHYWCSTGMTADRAIAVAMNFCTAHSPNGQSCHPVNEWVTEKNSDFCQGHVRKT